jgi:hypothetical protein
MAERTILVCDACGRPAAETVTIRSSRGNFVKDLCSTHVTELVSGARKPRPGRRKGVVANAGGSKAAGAKRGGAKRTRAKRTGAKRRGRPPKSQTS